MKLTLIKPNIGRREHSLYVDEGRMEPLQLGILAAITVETFTARRAYEISEEFRKRGVKTVMGGMHAMLIPEEVSEHCDCVIVGDAEPVWKTMLEDFQKGRLQSRYDVVQPEYPQTDVIPRRDIFEGKGYLPITLLQFSRGCSHRCSFCAYSVYFKAHHFCRPVEDVIREIKRQKRKLLFFVDDNIVCNHEKAKELFRALIPLKIRWVSQGSMDMLRDRELYGADGKKRLSGACDWV